MSPRWSSVISSSVRVAALCAFLALLPSRAGANTIQIELASRVTVSAGSVHVSVEVANHGTAPAHDVVTSIDFRGTLSAAAAMDTLAPDARRTAEFDVDVAVQAARGRWPMIVRARWRDTAGHVFEALHLDVVELGEPIAGIGLRVALDDVRVETSATTSARVTGGQPGTGVRLTLAAPVGLRLAALQTESMAGGGETTIPVSVATTGATVPSRLPVAAIVETDTEDGHHTAIAVAFVDVGPPLSRARTWIGSALVALLIASLMVMWRKLRS